MTCCKRVAHIPLNRLATFIVTCFVIYVVAFKLWYFTRSLRIKKSPDPNRTHKKILYYNAEYYSQYNGDDVFQNCPQPKCTFSTDNDDIDESSAVIFRHNALPWFAPEKKQGQIWIFTSSESPLHTVTDVKHKQWKDKFNWTLSYRRHSDFFFGYGDIVPRTQPIRRDYKKIMAGKERHVAWIVSHCYTLNKREDYVAEMRKYIDVDIYGKCGTKTCGSYSGDENDTCHDDIGKRYKFYLSFENVFCKDYTTEKFYFPFTFDKPIISVARGAYNMREYIPKDTYIDASNFESPKDLANYLLKIAKDDKEYIRLLKQKDKFISKTSPESFEESLCLICDRLHSRLSIKIANIDDEIFDNQCTHDAPSFIEGIVMMIKNIFQW